MKILIYQRQLIIYFPINFNKFIKHKFHNTYRHTTLILIKFSIKAKLIIAKKTKKIKGSNMFY